jgi:hypothetical protein
MSATQWLGLAISVCTLVAAFATSVRWLVKHYLYELKPNSGTSLKDSVIRLEEKVEILYQILIQKGKDGDR